MFRDVQAYCPTDTAVSELNPEPLTVIVVPPRIKLLLGLIDDTDRPPFRDGNSVTDEMP